MLNVYYFLLPALPLILANRFEFRERLEYCTQRVWPNQY